MKQMFPIFCCLLAKFFCLCISVIYIRCSLLFEACSSVVSLARNFFLVVTTVKCGSVKGFRKGLPVIFTYNQTKGNIFC